MKLRSRGSGAIVMTEGVIWRQLLLFILPIVFGSFFQQLYNTTDAVIVGNFVGKEALAAVGGTTASVINLLVGFFLGLSSGGTVIIAQCYGAKWDDGLQKAIHTAIALGILGGGVLMLIGMIFAPAILSAMGTPSDVFIYAVPYMRIYFLGVIPNLLYNMGAGILRALGDSRRPLCILIASCFVNIALDILFVAILKLGSSGAALATILCQTFSCFGVLIMMVRHREASCRLHPGKLISGFDTVMLGKIIRIGLPAGIQSSMYSISNVLIQSTVNSFGTDVVASWTIYGKLEGIFWMIIGAFGVAITTFTGQNFGAQKYDRIKKGVLISWLMSAVVTITLSVFFITCGKYVFVLFNDDPEVLRLCAGHLRVIPPLLITYTAIEIISGAVRGAGDSIRPMIITLVGVCALRVVWILLVVPHFRSMVTVALSYPLTWTVTSIVFLIYYLQGGWLKRCSAQLETKPKN